MSNETEAPERVWICSHLGEYGHYYPEAVEAEGEYGGVAISYVPEAISEAKDKRIAELESSLEDVSADFNDAHREKLELEAKLTEALQYYNVAGYEGKEARAALKGTDHG